MPGLQSPRVKVLALDYGSARTGVAVSDSTGTIARPLAVVRRVAGKSGLAELLALLEQEEPDLIVVGLPLTLRGEHGAQAQETEGFVASLRAVTDIPIETYDERFTTRMAVREGGGAPEDAAAAAHLLSGYLEWTSSRRS